MKRRILKGLGILLLMLVVGITVLIVWLRTGDEEPLDYSELSFSIGPKDPQINGYTYLRGCLEKADPDIPENYPVESSDDGDIWINYDRYENWDLEFFEDILEANQDFIRNVEVAFERTIFEYDQAFSPNSITPASQFRTYLRLRILETRVLYLSGQHEAGFDRLADLSEECQVLSESGGALIGLLSSIACNGILAHEFSVYQAHADLSAKQLRVAAENCDIGGLYPQIFEYAISQEFQFVRGVIEDIASFYVEAYKLISVQELSDLERSLFEMSVYVGLRKDRTINEIFLGYSDAAQQAFLPLKERHYVFADSLKISQRDLSWVSFVNRNPYGRFICQMLFPSITHVMEVFDHARASAHATRLSLALHAFYLEESDLPDELNELVPEYLPEIPKDPYDGQAMRYSKEKRIIYAVGNDFADNGGSESPFDFQVDEDYYKMRAEHDRSEPTFPLRFAM